ncbi:DUF4350 domain-containing protein [Halosimplex sp. TS25]|uniref:DUF4350 domain-containing protein n=1 Tax=Halosimplex rarum TaxID=3396619 RepID=UPI0039E844DB
MRTTAVTAAGGVLAERGIGRVFGAETIPELAFDSTSSLLDAAGEPLTDGSLVAVWAESTATNVDSDGNGDAVEYADGQSIPLVAVDGSVAGFGAMLAPDGTDFRFGNEEFLLNVWDDLVGSGTVLWDESHGQYYTLDGSNADGSPGFSTFESYAEDNGYAVEATESLADDLSDADGAVITSPAESFSDSEAEALAQFVDDGGAVFLHDQSDYGDFDQTENLNDVASALDVGFRFNDDQVEDETNNAGAPYVPTTTEFDDSFPFFENRDGLRLDLDPTETYEVEVVDVTDGDTVDVAFVDESGRPQKSIRVLGIDTPEKSGAADAERPEEWEGIADDAPQPPEGGSGDNQSAAPLDAEYPYLASWGAKAAEFAAEELPVGTRATLSFDPKAQVYDDFGRILGYLEYDRSGDGDRETLYNEEAVREGYARVYGSSYSRHDEFWAAEDAAREEEAGLWAASNPEESPPIRDGPVAEVFAPNPASVVRESGTVPPGHVRVFAESSAEQRDADTRYRREIPLAAVDKSAGVAYLGAPLISEDYEAAEGYPVDTAGYDNFAFVTDLIDELADDDGPVLIEGGHNQFHLDYSLSSEDAAYYQRYLEGLDTQFEQVNDVTSSAAAERLDDAKALIVTAPMYEFTDDEVDAVSSFADDGGAVVLMGSGLAPPAQRTYLDDVASGIGSDLRLGSGRVVDETSNLNDDPGVVTTGNFGPGRGKGRGKNGGKGRGNGKGGGKGQQK